MTVTNAKIADENRFASSSSSVSRRRSEAVALGGGAMKKRKCQTAEPFSNQQNERGKYDGDVGDRHCRGGGAAAVKYTTVRGTRSVILSFLDVVIMSMTPMIVLALLLDSR